MPNAHSLPLLRLPFLALETVINEMTFKNQLDLSDLSKRARWAVRASTSRGRFTMLFKCTEYVSVKIGTHSFPWREVDRCPLFSELKKFTTKISSTFKHLDVRLEISDGCPYRLIFELIPIFKQHNVTLEMVQVSSSVPNDVLCALTLEAAKEAKTLRIYFGTSPYFKPRELGAFNNLEQLHLPYSSWLTLDHLINHFMICPVIWLPGSQIPIQDLNIFFKKWVEGSRTESFQWSPMGDSEDTLPILPMVLDGIPCVALKRVKIRGVTEIFEKNECFMIEQVGGKKAIVFKTMFPVFMTTDFSLDFDEVSS